jgi:autotransporter-associated beta strand protein
MVAGTLSAGTSPGTLTIGGDLVLTGGSTALFELNSPGVVGGNDAAMVNDLVAVGGDLTLGGRFEARVAAAGYYRLFNYGGALLDASFDEQSITSTTAGFAIVSGEVQTAIAGEVNLSVLGSGQSMQFWDGDDLMGNGIVDGGSGAWTAAATNWTGLPGEADINGPWGGSVGVFAGPAGGPVTVIGTQSFDTLQFSTNGYVLTGGMLSIDPATGQTGTFNIDNGVTTTIGSVVADGSGDALAKPGGGTLILSGLNTYTGGTVVSGGVLQISSDANLGNASGGLTLAGATLRSGATFASGRTVSLEAGGGTFDLAGALLLGGTVSGAGGLTKAGAGTLDLTGSNTYVGGTAVAAGTLVGDAASIRGDLANAGTVAFDQSGDATFAGDIASFGGTDGAMVKQGAGTLTLAGTSLLDWAVG